ncbi:MAG: 1-acyl-sn-glycerol-3-phosphate acyltransferase [Lachnospiraceae bacterium]|nr:1-acyl-sn-glycerol-3-phosphate acyltransferase [Lachnospiraceae bacterium]
MKTFYYSDELKDDFAGTNIHTAKIDGSYPYLAKNPVRKAFQWVFYHIIATPIVFLYNKIGHGERIIGRSKLKPYRKTGCFLYGNHTRSAGDSYAPSLISFPRKAYIIAGPDAVSIPGIRRIVQDLGVIPLPSDTASARNFYQALEELNRRGNPIAIYPEAHIWPYYTKIRPFPDGSFRYPAEFNKPVFTFTTTYQKRGILPIQRATVTIDGPFFPDPEKSPRENRAMLREMAYEAMTSHSAENTFERYRYVKTDR